ncbi:ABC transporter permease [Quadrisphaera setariae]|uniref:ABC transporter permease n=1 Tax=Quadrisphaera setariae TaxID=2593304 RepID=A0A5C8Z5V5_9ACTN|nr:ABC transporter permease [Quadrisphaera setariae]TXR52653.1 ABC transporter permease [Quadrisphaera setariae]
MSAPAPARPNAAPPAPASPSARDRALAVFRSLPGPLVGLVVIVIVMSVLSPYFLTSRNLLNIVSAVSAIGIMAVGAALVIIIGGIDLSVGSVLAITAMFSAWLFKGHGMPFGAALVCALLLGAAIGLVNGLLATKGRVQPFVATLATMSAAAGLALYITDGNPITSFPSWFLALTENVPGTQIPVQGLIMVAVYLGAAFWLRYRPDGRALYAIGGNEEVARLSGLRVTSLKIRVYVIAGVLAAIAGMLTTSRLDSAQPSAGSTDLLNVIAVVVIGGASLAGGSGTMLGTFVGLLIIGTLNNGMSLLNVSPNLQPVVIGVVIIAAVMSDRGGRARLRGGH